MYITKNLDNKMKVSIAFIALITLFALINNVIAGECRRDHIPIGGASCERDFDCGNNFENGKCRNNTCICNKGYLEADCSYPAKSALGMGLLGLTLLTSIPGIPALVVGDIQWGIPQLLIGTPPLAGAIIASVFLCRGIGTRVAAGFTIGLAVLGFLAYVASCTWTLADAILYGLKQGNHACDGNGYPLM
jgi:hypothetical protein